MSQTNPASIDLKALISKEYSWEQSKHEFNQTLQRTKKSLPLFCFFVVVSKIILYLVSWFTVQADELMLMKPEKALYGLQLWRFFTAPFVTASLFGDLLFTTPVYLAIYLYPKEWNYGTFYTFCYFTLVNFSIQFVASAVMIPVSMFSEEVEDRLEWAFFSLLMVEQYRIMMKYGDSIADLIWFKLPYKYLIFVILLILNLLAGYDMANCVAVAVVGQSMVLMKDSSSLLQTVLKVEKILKPLLKLLPNYISAVDAVDHLKANTDNLRPFDRRQIHGDIGKTIQMQEIRDRWDSIPTNASGRTSASSGVALGGTRSRENSKLLQPNDTSIESEEDQMTVEFDDQ